MNLALSAAAKTHRAEKRSAFRRMPILLDSSLAHLSRKFGGRRYAFPPYGECTFPPCNDCPSIVLHILDSANGRNQIIHKAMTLKSRIYTVNDTVRILSRSLLRRR